MAAILVDDLFEKRANIGSEFDALRRCQCPDICRTIDP